MVVLEHYFRRIGMEHRSYGKTGVVSSVLGFGGMRFESIDDVDGCAALVHACWEAGITYFDTAPGYFGGKSETVMGVAFKEMKKERAQRPFTVATKTFADNREAVRAECERSLSRLQVDAIDFYHVWCVLSREKFVERVAQDTMKEFEKLKAEGLVKHICVSTHMAGKDVAWLLKEYPFDGVLMGYSAMNAGFREEGVAAAAELGRGVVVMNPLGGGLIAQHPERFEYLKTRSDETVTEAALRFLFSDPRIAVTLVGMANMKHLQDAVKAVSGYRVIPVEEIRRIKDGGGLNDICTGCGYCAECPKEIPIPKLMDAYNQYLVGGSVDSKSMAGRLAWHWGILHEGHGLEDCVECGLCEGKCTQKLPIVERMREVNAARKVFIAEQAAKK